MTFFRINHKAIASRSDCAVGDAAAAVCGFCGSCVCWHGASVWYSIASFAVSACMRRHNTALLTLDLKFNPIGDAGVVAIGEGLRYDV